jgi:hypothetical protein
VPILALTSSHTRAKTLCDLAKMQRSDKRGFQYQRARRQPCVPCRTQRRRRVRPPSRHEPSTVSRPRRRAASSPPPSGCLGLRRRPIVAACGAIACNNSIRFGISAVKRILIPVAFPPGRLITPNISQIPRLSRVPTGPSSSTLRARLRSCHPVSNPERPSANSVTRRPAIIKSRTLSSASPVHCPAWGSMCPITSSGFQKVTKWNFFAPAA